MQAVVYKMRTGEVLCVYQEDGGVSRAMYRCIGRAVGRGVGSSVRGTMKSEIKAKQLQLGTRINCLSFVLFLIVLFLMCAVL